MPAAANQRQAAAIPQTGQAARQAIRRGEWTGPTSGLAPGYVQGNLAILPAALAADFMRFCQLNPKPCPVLAAVPPATRTCRRSGPISTSAPTSAATRCSATANWSTSRPTSPSIGATIW